MGGCEQVVGTYEPYPTRFHLHLGIYPYAHQNWVGEQCTWKLTLTQISSRWQLKHHVLGRVSMQTARPPDSIMNKNKPIRMQRECGGVRFKCANQLLPSSQIQAHIPTSSSSSQLLRVEFQTSMGSLESSAGFNPSVTGNCRFKKTLQ